MGWFNDLYKFLDYFIKKQTNKPNRHENIKKSSFIKIS
jgi:hypothetical protein